MAGEKPSTDVANDLYVAATLGTYIHKEDFKADAVMTKDGKHAEEHVREADHLALVKLKMPYGEDRIYKQTEIMMDAETGAKLMAYERRNENGSVYLGKDGRPEAVLENVGNIGTNEDIAAFKKMVHGEDNPKLFESVSHLSQEWRAHAEERSNKEGLPMPRVDILAGHSMANYTNGAITLDLHNHGLDPRRTIEIEPVGAGAGLRYLAARSANPEATAQLLESNVYSFRAPTTIFHAPGGWGVHDNAMLGQTHEYAGAPGASAIISNHALTLPANDMLKYGVYGLNRTPEHDTPAGAILHDTRLGLADRLIADQGVADFTLFTKLTRGKDMYGDINTAPTDLHANAVNGAPTLSAVDLHPHPGDHQQQNVSGRTPRSYAGLKMSQPRSLSEPSAKPIADAAMHENRAKEHGQQMPVAATTVDVGKLQDAKRQNMAFKF